MERMVKEGMGIKEEEVVVAVAVADVGEVNLGLARLIGDEVLGCVRDQEAPSNKVAIVVIAVETDRTVNHQSVVVEM